MAFEKIRNAKAAYPTEAACDSAKTNQIASTIIGLGATFTGNMKTTGVVRVEGNLQGDCECKNNMFVGDHGKIEGDVMAENMVVSGTVNGNITLSGKLELKSTAHVVGDVTAGSLVVDENALFDGKCSMHRKEAAEIKFSEKSEV